MMIYWSVVVKWQIEFLKRWMKWRTESVTIYYERESERMLWSWYWTWAWTWISQWIVFHGILFHFIITFWWSIYYDFASYIIWYFRWIVLSSTVWFRKMKTKIICPFNDVTTVKRRQRKYHHNRWQDSYFINKQEHLYTV